MGAEACVLDAGTYAESSPTQRMAAAPRHLLANNLALPGEALDALPRRKVDIAAPGRRAEQRRAAPPL